MCICARADGDGESNRAQNDSYNSKLHSSNHDSQLPVNQAVDFLHDSNNGAIHCMARFISKQSFAQEKKKE